MANIRYTKSLAEEYQRLYDSCEIKSSRFYQVDKIVDNTVKHQRRYESVSDALGIPWYFIAAIHDLESSRNFSRHLHNGDPLTRRTLHIPAGRPRQGSPPFTWEESAVDALKFKNLHRIKNWELPRLLYELERYNGWGYRTWHPEVLSPYLWSFSNHYQKGKYVADGRWSYTAVSRQCGGAVLIRRLEERHIIETHRRTAYKTPFLRYANKKLKRADDLQRFLNTFPDIHLRIDSIPGNITSEAVHKVFGFYLQGDSRSTQKSKKKTAN